QNVRGRDARDFSTGRIDTEQMRRRFLLCDEIDPIGFPFDQTWTLIKAVRNRSGLATLDRHNGKPRVAREIELVSHGRRKDNLLAVWRESRIVIGSWLIDDLLD